MSVTPETCDQQALELRPSTVLDGLIHQRLIGPVIFIGERCIIGRDHVPAYSSSIDAAASLVSRLLPGSTWCLRSGPDSAAVELVPASGTAVMTTSLDAAEPHPGLLICIALFAALETVLHGGEPDPERGKAALLCLLQLPADGFGRREIAQLQIG